MRPFLLLVMLLLLAAKGMAAVRYDMTKAELLQELGKPTSTLVHPGSGREVLNYPKGVRIEVEKGIVVSVKGLDLAEVEAATKGAAEAKAAAEAQAKLEQEMAEKVQAAEAAAEAKAAKEEAAAEKAERHQRAKEARAEAAEEKDDEKNTVMFSLVGFFMKLFISWVLMVLALKLTTKYWGVDVDWSGILLAAAAESGTRAVIGLVAEYVFHTEDLFYIDQAVATFVLVFVLRKVSTNQSLNQAVGIAMGVKVFSLVVGAILFTVLLNVMH